MAVRLEQYSVDAYAISQQARSLNGLILRESWWLKVTQPGTVKRYEKLPDAEKNVLRIAKHSQVEASIVRRDEVAIGIATAIFKQIIVHPQEGEFEGTDLDYWIAVNESDDTHRAVARSLTVRYGLEPIFATIIEGHPNSAKGFKKEMAPLGEPAVLSTGGRPDPFEVARNNQKSQLYVGKHA